jgi:cell division septum initiation protein DivIVA
MSIGEPENKMPDRSSGGREPNMSVSLARRMRGYDVDATDALIRDLSAKNDTLRRRNDELEGECATLRDRVTRLEAEVARNREREKQVSRALTAAQAHAAEVKDSARREAETVLGKARAESERRAEKAERLDREREKAERELERLRRIQQAVQTGLTGFLTEAIEQLRSDDETDIQQSPSPNGDRVGDTVDFLPEPPFRSF